MHSDDHEVVRPAGDASEGQSMVEYALLVMFAAIMVVAVMVVLGPQISDFLLGRVDEEATGEAHHAISEAMYE